MKPRLFFIVIGIIAAVVLSACAGTPTRPAGEAAVNSPIVPTSLITSTSSSGNIDYAALGLTPAEIQQWQDKGIASVATPDTASALAGFTVLTPAYMPPTLLPGSMYSVHTNAPVLKQVGSQAPPQVRVEQIWNVPGTKTMSIILIQSNTPFQHAGVLATPTAMCGATVQVGTEPLDAGAMAGGTVYHWEEGGCTFDLTGVLSDALTAAELDKVVCSIINP